LVSLLCLTQYLHKRVSGPVSFVVDLLAAVPSIIFVPLGTDRLGSFLAQQRVAHQLDRLDSPVQQSVDPKGSVFVASVVWPS
jgi:phosphate transport system permease protein